MKKMILFIFLGSFFACNQKKAKNIPPSFYYWKNTYLLTDFEKLTLSHLNVQKIYLRVFDVNWENGKPVPANPLTSIDLHNKYNIIPCVHISQAVINNLDTSFYDYFADLMIKQVALAATDNQFTYKSVLLDFEVDKLNYKKYYLLLKKLKEQLKEIDFLVNFPLDMLDKLPKNQALYWDMLMVKLNNTAPPQKDTAHNSILDLTQVKQLAVNIPKITTRYAAVIPLYSWAIQYRKDSIIRYLPRRSSTDFLDQDLFWLVKGRYQLAKDTVFKNIPFLKGDEIKVEAVNETKYLNLTKLLVPYAFKELVYFDIDEPNMRRFNHEVLVPEIQ